MKLKDSTKEEIRKAIALWEEPLRAGASPAHILDLIAKHAIGLLELDDAYTKDWYEEEPHK